MDKYQQCGDFISGRCLVHDWDTDLYGYIDIKNNVVIDCIYYGGCDFNEEGIACVKNKQNLWAYIDKDGNELTDFVYCADSNEFHEQRAKAYYKNKKFGFIDLTCKTVIPYIYNRCGYFNDNITWISQPYGTIDNYGFVSEKEFKP